MKVVGIDPGLKGFAVCLDENRNVIEVRSTKDIFDFAEWVSTIKPDFVLIEEQFPIPAQGLGSTATTLKRYGELVGVLKATKTPFQEIHPMSWKKHFSLVRKPKSASMVKAKQLFPSLHKEINSHDKAEAFLLAELAYRLYHGGDYE